MKLIRSMDKRKKAAPPRSAWRLAAAVLLFTFLGGCTAASYYWQGVRGQMDLLERARSISTVLASTDDPALKRKLERVLAIREFASHELALPDNPSYRSYTDLGRRFVLWNVFATPELSLEPRQWCFPVVGCVNYRGYFDEAAARSEASKLAATGDDVYVGGVPAYSTLGYFNDPMVSTVIRYPDTEVARLIFHELAHQVAYAPGDTTFNESFATAVERIGSERWLQANASPEVRERQALTESRRHDFHVLVRAWRAKLDALYRGDLPEADKRARKAQLYAGMRADYDAMKNEKWGGYKGYDRWFANANNAALGAQAAYDDQVGAFERLFAAQGSDFDRFYAEVRRMATLPRKERDAAMAPYRDPVPVAAPVVAPATPASGNAVSG
jgi:predicted aminopeptidase